MDPDLQLLRALQAGEDLALNELIQRHREALFRFVFRYLRDRTAAADVVQETFVRVYFNAAKYKPRSTVRTWLFAIAINQCRDRFRWLGRRRHDVSLDAAKERREMESEEADPCLIPSEQVAQADRFQSLQQAIDQLPERLKLPLVLCALEGKSHKEAAEIMATTPKTIELRIYHAKTKLREILGHALAKG